MNHRHFDSPPNKRIRHFQADESGADNNSSTWSLFINEFFHRIGLLKALDRENISTVFPFDVQSLGVRAGRND